MCQFLSVTRSLVYYKPTPRKADTAAENAVIDEFKKNWQVYGTIKLKKALARRDKPIVLSRRKIGKIMNKHGLVSKYVKRRKKGRKKDINEDNAPNIVSRDFDTDSRKPLEVIVSDLTYVKVDETWHYVCLLIDLSNREIIGSACGRKKDGELVKKAFYSVRRDLRDIEIFHSDRGGEFKNAIIDGIMKAFKIRRSLSAKGTPVDNAVSESMYNILKTEMVFGETFKTLDELELRMFEFVNWYNNKRLHSTLGYVPPREYAAKG
jgi:transposase InsO family protein